MTKLLATIEVSVKNLLCVSDAQLGPQQGHTAPAPPPDTMDLVTPVSTYLSWQTHVTATRETRRDNRTLGALIASLKHQPQFCDQSHTRVLV